MNQLHFKLFTQYALQYTALSLGDRFDLRLIFAEQQSLHEDF